MMKTDTQLQHAVQDELTWDTRLEAAQIGVAVTAGVVTLTGVVSSWAKRLAAQQAAHQVAGVLDVANDIVVKPSGDSLRTDTELAAAVRRALEWDVLVPHERIHCTVANGVVTLTGEVATPAQRAAATAAVGHLIGVRTVVDAMTLEQFETTPDSIRDAIQRALERRADREAARIRIDVEGSQVTLHGDVQTWRERSSVLGAVTGTRGVEKIVDHLRVV